MSDESQTEQFGRQRQKSIDLTIDQVEIGTDPKSQVLHQAATGGRGKKPSSMLIAAGAAGGHGPSVA